MKLLVDIGNSRLKWGLEEGGNIVCRADCDYRQGDFILRLQADWQSLNPKRIAIASVGHTTVFQQVKQLCSQLWPEADVFVAVASSTALGVSNAYNQPERLGVDRWLALLAANRRYPGKVCIVDCGTAITVDVLDNGRHVGGLIAPGLTTMRKSLQSETAALEEAEWSSEVQFASQTEAAIAAGTQMAAIGLIRTSMQRLDADYRLLLTGGDGELLAAKLDFPVIVDRDLVLKGLSVLADAEENE